MKSLTGFILFLLTLEMAVAAIPKNQTSETDWLKNKKEQRVSHVKKQGKTAIRRVRSLAFDSRQPVQVRWKALMTLAYVGREEVMPELKLAIKSGDWFMRDAGLIAMSRVNSEEAKKAARSLLTDPSLVVRTSAVKVLHQLKDSQSRALLWERLDAPQNFRGTQSLWIRRHMVEALKDFSEKGDTLKFVKLLDDKDVRVHQPAVEALRKLSGEKPTQKLSLNEERKFWKEWSLKL